MKASSIPMNILRPLKILDDADHSFASLEHKPILAERFKTKMCRNYEQTGSCPYVHRCMFAHGDHDLRTKNQNVAENLFTEEAIKQFQRVRMLHGESPSLPSANRGTPSPTSLSSSSCDCDTGTGIVRRGGVYRHDPYKAVALQPRPAKQPGAYEVSYANASVLLP